MNKQIKLNKSVFAKMFLLVFIFSMFFTGVVLAQSTTNASTSQPQVKCEGIVPCCEASGCDFDGLIMAVKKVVDWGVSLALMFTVVVIAYAGFLYLTSASNPGGIDQAKRMFTSVLKGIFFILAAWLIVTLIMSALAKDVPIFLK